MRLSKFTILLSACSFFACDGLKVNVGISSGDITHGIDCVDPDGKSYTKKYEDTKNWVCFPPSDARTLLEKCEISKGK